MRRAALAAALVLAATGAAAAAADDDCLLHCPTHRGSFGSPEPDKECVLRCLSGNPSTPSENTLPAPRFSKGWNESAALQKQRRALQALLDRIPDKRFRDWATRSVLFERASQGNSPTIGVRPGMLTIYDTFWKLSSAGQMNTLVFELGKILWFERINPGPPEARPPQQAAFESLYWPHQAAFEAMKSARWQGEGFGTLGDSDLQSWFGYACRAMVLNPEPLPPAPKDWQETRASMDRFIGELLAAH